MTFLRVMKMKSQKMSPAMTSDNLAYSKFSMKLAMQACDLWYCVLTPQSGHMREAKTLLPYVDFIDLIGHMGPHVSVIRTPRIILALLWGSQEHFVRC